MTDRGPSTSARNLAAVPSGYIGAGVISIVLAVIILLSKNAMSVAAMLSFLIAGVLLVAAGVLMLRGYTESVLNQLEASAFAGLILAFGTVMWLRAADAATVAYVLVLVGPLMVSFLRWQAVRRPTAPVPRAPDDGNGP